MIRWAAGSARRALGAVLLILMLVCGAEVALRFLNLRAARTATPRRAQNPWDKLATPSWTTYQELRPLAAVRIRTASGDPHVVRTNSLGLRGPETATPKPADAYRVLCLGDEQLLAVHLAEEDSVSQILQDTLQQETRLRIEVLNAGVPGACPLTEYLLLTRRLALLQPDLVLAFVRSDDLLEDMAYRRLTRMDHQGVPLACRHPQLGGPRAPSALIAWRDEFRLVDLGLRWAGDVWRQKTELEGTLTADGSPRPNLARLLQNRTLVDRMIQPLSPLSAWCRDSYAAFCVIHVRDDPNGSGAAGEAGAASFAEQPLSVALHDFTRTENILFLELTRSTNSIDSTPSAFWTADEHREYARQIAQRLLKDVSGPWSSPYFRSQESPIAPAAHQTGDGTNRRGRVAERIPGVTER